MTMTLKDQIDGLHFVKRVIGFAKMGLAVQPSVRQAAFDRFRALAEQQSIAAEAAPTASRALEQLRHGLLPEVAVCASGMDEIDQQLLPMRRTQRATQQAMEAAQADGERSVERPRG